MDWMAAPEMWELIRSHTDVSLSLSLSLPFSLWVKIKKIKFTILFMASWLVAGTRAELVLHVFLALCLYLHNNEKFPLFPFLLDKKHISGGELYNLFFKGYYGDIITELEDEWTISLQAVNRLWIF